MKFLLKPDYLEVQKLAGLGGGSAAHLLAHALKVRPSIELMPIDGAKPYYVARGFVPSVRTGGYYSLIERRAAIPLGRRALTKCQ